jgi:trigger factor
VALKADLEELEKNKVKMKVEVPAEEVQKAIDRAFRDLAREVFIPGFRKGKAPRRVLQARLGMETIYDEVKQSNLPEYYSEALKQLGIEPIDEPEIDVEEIEIEEGKPLVFEVTVDIKPRVELKEYRGVEVEKPDEGVTEQEIDEVLDNMREKFAQLDVVSGKTLAEGDFALIDYEGTVNDQPIDGGSSKDFMLEVGTPDIWPEFNEELKEKRKGDILDIKVKMPDQLPNQDLAGKIASFKVIVKEVKVKRLPEADDDFAKESSKFDTLQELREDIRSKLEEAKSSQAEESVRSQALKKLADELEVEIPEKMVEDYVRQRQDEMQARLASRGISMDSYLKASDITEDRMKDELTAEANRLIKNELVLDAVIRAEGIDVSEEEVQEEIENSAGMLGIRPEEYRRVLEERDSMEGFAEELKHRKALKFLGDHAVFAGEGANKAALSEEASQDTGEQGETQ